MNWTFAKTVIKCLFDFVVICFPGVGVGLCQSKILGTEFSTSSKLSITSPDHRFTIISGPPVGSDDYARLYLVAGRAQHLFARYYRSGFIAWSPDSRFVVFIDYHSPEDSRLCLFWAEKSGILSIERADSRIRRSALSMIKNGEVLFYTLKLLGFKETDKAILGVHISYLRSKQAEGPSSSLDLFFTFDLKSNEIIDVHPGP